MEKKQYVRPFIEVVVVEGVPLCSGSGSVVSMNNIPVGTGEENEESGPEYGGDKKPDLAPRRRNLFEEDW